MDMSGSSFYAASQAVYVRSREYSVASSAILALTALLIFWRIWRFTLYPLLHPNEPKELPYWVPVMGHGFAFFHNSHRLINKARAYFNDTREPFAITAFGSTFCVITEPRHTTEVYKNTVSLSFEEFLFGLMRYLGLGGETLDAVFHTPLPKDKMGFPNPRGTALGFFVRDMHHHQLFPGENLDQLEKVMMDWFDRHLTLGKLQALCASYSKSTDTGFIEVPLAKWCSEFFTRAGEIAYFGDSLQQLEPDMATTFLEYDDLSWQVLYQYPRVFSSKMHAAMGRIQGVFLRYFEIPQEKRSGDAWFTKAIENECRALGINQRDLGRFMGMVYWVVSTNTRKAAFWLLYHLVKNPELIPAIREEVATAFQDSTVVDVNYLHNSCPHLENAWFETLRVSSNSASARVVRQDTSVGGHLIRKGRKILIPYRLLHHDGDVFGDEVEQFRPGRFESGAPTRGPSWRPFGGGQTMCPGHFIAKRETVIFAAIVLHRFDIVMASPGGVLDIDLGKPVLGLADRKDGQDVVIKLTPRKASKTQAT